MPFIQTCLDEFEKGNRIFWAIDYKTQPIK